MLTVWQRQQAPGELEKHLWLNRAHGKCVWFYELCQANKQFGHITAVTPDSGHFSDQPAVQKRSTDT